MEPIKYFIKYLEEDNNEENCNNFNNDNDSECNSDIDDEIVKCGCWNYILRLFKKKK